MLLHMRQASRCRAKSKRSRKCQSPAVRGSMVCRMHGASGGAPKRQERPGVEARLKSMHTKQKWRKAYFEGPRWVRRTKQDFDRGARKCRVQYPSSVKRGCRG
jgi:hypothetical protein